MMGVADTGVGMQTDVCHYTYMQFFLCSKEVCCAARSMLVMRKLLAEPEGRRERGPHPLPFPLPLSLLLQYTSRNCCTHP